jgi:hypothetical protein
MCELLASFVLILCFLQGFGGGFGGIRLLGEDQCRERGSAGIVCKCGWDCREMGLDGVDYV